MVMRIFATRPTFQEAVTKEFVLGIHIVVMWTALTLSGGEGSEARITKFTAANQKPLLYDTQTW